MRRLLLVVVVLAGLFSILIGASAYLGQSSRENPGCILVSDFPNANIYDLKTGATLHVPNGAMIYSAERKRILGSSGPSSLIELTTTAARTVLYLQKPEGVIQLLENVESNGYREFSKNDDENGYVYFWVDYNQLRHIWIIPLAYPKPLIFVIPSSQPFSVEWSPGGRYFSYLQEEALHIRSGTDPNWDMRFEGVKNILWSPRGQRLALLTTSNQSRQIVRIMNAETHIIEATYEIDTESGEAAVIRAWSPDGRYLAVAKGKPAIDDIDFLGGYTLIDTETGIVFTPTGKFNAKFSKFLPDGHTLLTVDLANLPYQVLIDPINRVQQRLFPDPDTRVWLSYQNVFVYSTTTADQKITLRQLDLDGMRDRILMEGIDWLGDSRFYGKSRYFLIEGKKDGNRFLLTHDLQGTTPPLIQAINSDKYDVWDFAVKIDKDHAWLAVNYIDDQDQKVYGLTINLETHEVRVARRGQFTQTLSYQLERSTGLVFVNSADETSPDYEIYDEDANLLAHFQTTKEQLPMWKQLSPDHQSLLIRKNDDQGISTLWVVPNGARSGAPIYTSPSNRRFRRELVAWAQDSAHFIFVQTSDLKTASDRGLLTYYDLKGVAQFSRPIASRMFNTSYFDAASCNPESLALHPN